MTTRMRVGRRRMPMRVTSSTTGRRRKWHSRRRTKRRRPSLSRRKRVKSRGSRERRTYMSHWKLLRGRERKGSESMGRRNIICLRGLVCRKKYMRICSNIRSVGFNGYIICIVKKRAGCLVMIWGWAKLFRFVHI
jgi:hypothetical protein